MVVMKCLRKILIELSSRAVRSKPMIQNIKHIHIAVLEVRKPEDI